MPSLKGAATRSWPVLGLVLLLSAITLLAPLGGLTLENRVTGMLINVIIVVGFYVFAGTSGVLSFGHMSFTSIGAYIGALVTISPTLKATQLPDLPGWLADAELSLLAAALVAGCCVAAFAAVISIPLMRLPNLSISLGMFAVLVIVYQVESNWTDVTRGRSALVGVPTNTGLYVALGATALVIALAYAYQQSRNGLWLRASRDDEPAAAAIGIDINRERRIALTLSGFLLGVAGVLYAQFLGVLTPNSFYLDLTFLTIAMLVIGGVRSLAGAVIGPVFVTALTYVLQQIEQGVSVGPLQLGSSEGLQQVGLALAMLMILIFRPRGIMGGNELPLPWRRSRSGRDSHGAARTDAPAGRNALAVSHAEETVR